MAKETKIQKISRRHAALQQEYDNNWKPHHQELTKYLFPRSGRFLDTDTTANDGKKRHQDIYDGTAIWALRTLAAGMWTGLTSPVKPWFKFTLADKDRAKFKPVRLWLDDARDRVLAVLSRSNFYPTIHAQYSELGGFGTGGIQIEKDYKTVVRFYGFTVGEYVVDTDQFGRVDTLARTFKLQVRNVIAKFGKDNVSKAVQTLYTSDNLQAWVKIHHIMEPNVDRVLDKVDNGNMAYRSVYYEDGTTDDKFLSDKGYNEKPFVAPRWSVVGSEAYGGSPGMDVLGEMKMLHIMRKEGMQALAKMVRPPTNAPASMKSEAANLLAGGVNYYNDLQGERQGLTPVFVPNLSLGELREERLLSRADVERLFYTDLFFLLRNDPQQKQVTAYEIAKRYEQKLELLGPIIARIQPEMLDDILKRVFNIMMKFSLFPPAPAELEGQTADIELISLLAQAQKMSATAGIEQVTGYVQTLANTHPEAVDMLDADATVSEYANSAGSPSKIIRSQKEVAEIREARAAELARQQEIEENTGIVEGAKTLSQADLSGDNALTAYLEAAQGGG